MSSVSLIDGHMDYTDDEIIKALECCINDNCGDCPETFGNCELTTMRNALDLLKRQREEIEKLTDSRNRWRKIAEDFDIATREKETVGE